MKKYIFVFLLISFNLNSSNIVSSFNKFIKFDLKFIQDTNNGFSSTQSIGQIYRKENIIEITVDSPIKEKYVIRDTFIEIIDYDFNQTQRLDINNKDLIFIKCSGTWIFELDTILVKISKVKKKRNLN